MSILDSHNEDERPLRVQNVPKAALNTHERNRVEAEAKANKMQNAVDEALAQDASAMADTEDYSLNDDRRVKTLSPTMLVVKRFLRNRVAMAGLIILAFMFVFSFIGGIVSPYREDQLFYREDAQNKQFAGVTENKDFRYVTENDGDFPSVARAKFTLSLNGYKGDASEQLPAFTREMWSGLAILGRLAGSAINPAVAAVPLTDAAAEPAAVSSIVTAQGAAAAQKIQAKKTASRQTATATAADCPDGNCETTSP